MARLRTLWAVDFLEDLSSGFSSYEGVTSVVPAGNKAPDLVEPGHGGDVGPMQGLTLDDTEPDLHKVEPRRRAGGEVDSKSGVLCPPGQVQRGSCARGSCPSPGAVPGLAGDGSQDRPFRCGYTARFKAGNQVG